MASLASPLPSSVAKNKRDMIFVPMGVARRSYESGKFWESVSLTNPQKWGPQFGMLPTSYLVREMGSTEVNLGAVGNLKPYIFPLARNWGDQ